MPRFFPLAVVCFLLEILVGCAGARWHQEGGIINPSLIPGSFGDETISAVQAGVKLESTVCSVGPVEVDLGIGPSVIRPFDGKGQGAFLDTSLRFRYTEWPVEPYLMWNTGAGWFDEWKPQGTDWGFVLQAAVGVRVPWSTKPDNNEWITFDYRWWHESNGTKVFDHDRHPNPGFEGGAFFIGYAFTGF